MEHPHLLLESRKGAAQPPEGSKVQERDLPPTRIVRSPCPRVERTTGTYRETLGSQSTAAFTGALVQYLL